jgi:predicted lactoylglutathione lyase
MTPDFPPAVPEIPVTNIDQAAAYYVEKLGYTLDWGGEDGGIAGISQGQCRVFLTNPAFRQGYGNAGPVLIWLNVNSRQEVDELHARWKSSGAILLSEPEDKPWHLREFITADPDGNRLRVFYDFGSEVRLGSGR